MKLSLIAIPLIALLPLSNCDRAREVATKVGISRGAQDYCEALYSTVLPGREDPIDFEAIQAGFGTSTIACLLEVARSLTGREVVEVVAVETPTEELAGELITTEPKVAAQIEEAELVTGAEAEGLLVSSN